MRAYRGSTLPSDAACVCGVSNPITLCNTRGAVRCYNCRALERAAMVA
jgi:hypothetical protein